MKDLAKTLGIEKNVFFLGFQKNPFKFLYNADIFVLSSLWEGFGNVIVEAMRCDLPIISSDCPSGPREILSPCSDIFHRLKRENELCEFGILTPVDDSVNLSNSMNKILEDDILQRKYKEQSILRVNDFSKEIIVAKFIKYVLES